LIMYSLAVATGLTPISGTEVDTGFVQDAIWTRDAANHLIMPTRLALLAAYGQGATLGRMRLSTPQFRSYLLPYIWPINAAALPGSNPPLMDLRDNPLFIDANQPLEVDFTNTSGAATDQETGVLWLGDGNLQPPAGGPMLAVRCTAAITAVALTWTAGTLTIGQAIGAGTWAIVNAQCVSATCIAYRFIVPFSKWRPGGLGQATIGQYTPFQGRMLPFGMWNTFNTLNPPQLEIFCSGADAAQVVNMTLIKVSDSLLNPPS
jgi:hypothetical protein